MARGDQDQRLLVSVFDRLLGDQKEGAGESSSWCSKDALKAGVRRDLEALLNTRSRCLSWPEHFTELETSSVGFGVPDFSGANLASQAQKEHFRGEIEQAIRRFEPRFKSVRVALGESDNISRSLSFRIDALMYADPVPIQLLFDSVIDPGSRHVSVIGK